MLHNPTHRKERILIYGRSNCGKTSSWLALGDWKHRTNSDFNIHVADTDGVWDIVRPVTGELDDIQVTRLYTDEYREWLDWVKKTRANVKPNDWVVVDMIGKAWEAAQTYYWSQVGSDDLLADIYLANQRALETKGAEGKYMAGAHGANWGLINRYHAAFFEKVVNMPCNVLCVTSANEVRDDSDPALKNHYKVGWSPAGQKLMAHGFPTLLFAAQTPREWVYTTIRELGPIGYPKREYLKGESVDDFVMTYLLGTAGWRM